MMDAVSSPGIMTLLLWRDETKKAYAFFTVTSPVCVEIAPARRSCGVGSRPNHSHSRGKSCSGVLPSLPALSHLMLALLGALIAAIALMTMKT
jgi:hypothetical protein